MEESPCVSIFSILAIKAEKRSISAHLLPGDRLVNLAIARALSLEPKEPRVSVQIRTSGWVCLTDTRDLVGDGSVAAQCE
jgi:hypothetical protein